MFTCAQGQQIALCLFASAIVAVMLCTAHFVGIHPDYATFWPIGAVIGAGVAGWCYAYWREMAAAQTACSYFLASVLISLSVLVYSYVTLRASLPLADQWLAKGDALLGISVPALVNAADQSATASYLFEKSYDSIGLQLILIPVMLGLLNYHGRSQQMLLSHLVICLISCSISMWFPSVGSFDYYEIAPNSLANLHGTIGYHYQASFFAAREEAIFTLPLGVTSGVITFPSIHAATAILCAWSCWPIRTIRIPVTALNVTMFVSTIPVGAHYGIDLIAGALVAIMVIALGKDINARWLMQTFRIGPSTPVSLHHPSGERPELS